MVFSIAMACEEYFDNTGGGGIRYGGTGTSGEISGNPTGGSGTGSSHPGGSGGSADSGGEVIPKDLYIDFEIVGDLSLLKIPDEWGELAGSEISYRDDGTVIVRAMPIFLYIGDDPRLREYYANNTIHADPIDLTDADRDGVLDVQYTEDGTQIITAAPIILHLGDDDPMPTLIFLADEVRVIGGEPQAAGAVILVNDLDVHDANGVEITTGAGPVEDVRLTLLVDRPDGSSIVNGGFTAGRFQLDFDGSTATNSVTGQEYVASFDIFSGEAAPVRISLGTSRGDVIVGSGNLFGGGGNDSLSSQNSGVNLLNGGVGNDTLAGGAGGDVLIGGEGFDTASYSRAGSGVVVNLATEWGSVGDAAGDTYSGIENVFGSAHGDTLTGNTGGNVLSGGAGNDTLEGGAGGDVLAGGEGFDVASYVWSYSAVIVNLATGYGTGGDAAGDSYSSIENVFGSFLDDQLTGNAGGNVLVGGIGNDTLSGGAGGDVLNGEAGFDTASYARANAGVAVNLATGSGSAGEAAGDTLTSIENVFGSAFDDTLFGDSRGNVLSGGAGNDTLAGGAGGDVLAGEAGFDTASYTQAGSGVAVNLATGSGTLGDATGDSLSGIENVFGSAFDDQLTGDAGGNVLSGGGGGDRLAGGFGNDLLIGEGGSDMFVFNSTLNASGNVDQIADFSAGDNILLSGRIFSSLTTGSLSASAFKLGASAGTAGERILYNKATGDLSFDGDGAGGLAAITFAKVAANTELGAQHFQVLAATDFWA